MAEETKQNKQDGQVTISVPSVNQEITNHEAEPSMGGAPHTEINADVSGGGLSEGASKLAVNGDANIQEEPRQIEGE